MNVALLLWRIFERRDREAAVALLVVPGLLVWLVDLRVDQALRTAQRVSSAVLTPILEAVVHAAFPEAG
jgi:hypothetical protein